MLRFEFFSKGVTIGPAFVMLLNPDKGKFADHVSDVLWENTENWFSISQGGDNDSFAAVPIEV